MTFPSKSGIIIDRMNDPNDTQKLNSLPVAPTPTPGQPTSPQRAPRPPVTCSFVTKGGKLTLVTETHVVVCEVISIRTRGVQPETGTELDIDTQVEVTRNG